MVGGEKPKTTGGEKPKGSKMNKQEQDYLDGLEEYRPEIEAVRDGSHIYSRAECGNWQMMAHGGDAFTIGPSGINTSVSFHMSRDEALRLAYSIIKLVEAQSV